jgi:hypothetical protein
MQAARSRCSKAIVSYFIFSPLHWGSMISHEAAAGDYD